MTWAEIQERARQRPRLLEDWRKTKGPETTGALQAAVDSSSLNLADLSRAFDLGTVVSPESAMRVSAVYACVQLIAGAIATIPLPIYERKEDSRARTSHPYSWLFNEQPNIDMSASSFWRYISSSMLLYGDGFARIERGSIFSNKVFGLRPIHPDRITPYYNDQNALRYRITEGGTVTVYDASDVLQFTTLGFDGLRSLSPIQHAARSAINIAMAADEHSESFFANSARPDYFLSVDGKLDKQQRDDLRTMLIRQHQGPANSHLPGVLQGDWKLQQLQMSNTDAQLLESRSFQLEEIARIYGVPPFMVGHTQKTTSWGSGIEQMGIGFVKYTLQPHLVSIEQELNRKIWPVREKYFVEFNTSGLERGDYKTRNEGYRIALGRAGEPAWMTVNEVRRMENLPPVDGGDDMSKPNEQTASPASGQQEQAATEPN